MRRKKKGEMMKIGETSIVFAESCSKEVIIAVSV